MPVPKLVNDLHPIRRMGVVRSPKCASALMYLSKRAIVVVVVVVVAVVM